MIYTLLEFGKSPYTLILNFSGSVIIIIIVIVIFTASFEWMLIKNSGPHFTCSKEFWPHISKFSLHGTYVLEVLINNTLCSHRIIVRFVFTIFCFQIECVIHLAITVCPYTKYISFSMFSLDNLAFYPIHVFGQRGDNSHSKYQQKWFEKLKKISICRVKV